MPVLVKIGKNPSFERFRNPDCIKCYITNPHPESIFCYDPDVFQNFGGLAREAIGKEFSNGPWWWSSGQRALLLLVGGLLH